MILCDHSAPITDLCFMRDDASLITTSSDGSVYSWQLGAPTRDQEYVCKGISATRLAISKNKEKDCYIVACFESQADDVLPLAANVVKLRRQSSIAIRKLSKSHTGLQSLMGFMNTENPMANFLSENSTNTPLLQTTNSSKSGLAPGTKKKNYMAVWTDRVSSTPKLVYTEAPIRAIALGETDGFDKFEICVLGMEDGRILISLLPLPFKVVDPNFIGVVPSNPNINTATVTGTLNITRGGLHHGNSSTAQHSSMGGSVAGHGKKVRRPLHHVNNMTVLQETMADAVSRVSTGDFSSNSSVVSESPSQHNGLNLSVNMDAIQEDNSSARSPYPQSPSSTAHSTQNYSANSPKHSPYPNHNASSNALVPSGITVDLLDESACKVLRLHVEP